MESLSLKAIFSSLDTDGSGELDKDELWIKLSARGTREQQATELIEMVDKNGDGRVII